MAHTSGRSGEGARAPGEELRKEGGAGGRDAYQRKKVGCAPLVPTPPVRRSAEEEAGRGGDRQFVLLLRCLRLAET